jgi:hypothetical protein
MRWTRLLNLQETRHVIAAQNASIPTAHRVIFAARSHEHGLRPSHGRIVGASDRDSRNSGFVEISRRRRRRHSPVGTNELASTTALVCHNAAITVNTV